MSDDLWAKINYIRQMHAKGLRIIPTREVIVRPKRKRKVPLKEWRANILKGKRRKRQERIEEGHRKEQERKAERRRQREALFAETKLIRRHLELDE